MAVSLFPRRRAPKPPAIITNPESPTFTDLGEAAPAFYEGGTGDQMGLPASPAAGGPYTEGSTPATGFAGLSSEGPFNTGFATPYGVYGGNLPMGWSVPASQGLLGQGAQALGFGPSVQGFANSVLGGLPGLFGEAVSQGINSAFTSAPTAQDAALTAQGFNVTPPSASPLGRGLGRAGSEVASAALQGFGSLPVPGLSALNSILGMMSTNAQNTGTQNALNTVANQGLAYADPQALGRVSMTAPAINLAQGFAQGEMQGVPSPYALGLEAAYGNPQAQSLMNLANAMQSRGQSLSITPEMSQRGETFTPSFGQRGGLTSLNPQAQAQFGEGARAFGNVAMGLGYPGVYSGMGLDATADTGVTGDAGLGEPCSADRTRDRGGRAIRWGALGHSQR